MKIDFNLKFTINFLKFTTNFVNLQLIYYRIYYRKFIYELKRSSHKFFQILSIYIYRICPDM